MDYYEYQPCEIIYSQDKAIPEATGWIVIDKLVNGVAGGGLFMDPMATLAEVKDLAKTMTYKNALNTPSFGGAKGGIRYDPTKNNANIILKNFLKDHKYLIETIWSTGADLNTTNEAIHTIITQELGLVSSFHSLGEMVSKRYGIQNQADQLLSRINYRITNELTIGNAVTGYSVAHCIRRVFKNEPKRVLIQGFGKVGSSLAYYLKVNQLGEVVGICEKNGFLKHHSGLDVEKLLQHKASYDKFSNKNLTFLQWLKHRYSNEYDIVFEKDDIVLLHDFLRNNDADIFCPCATRYQITSEVAEIIIQKYAHKKPQFFIISGANNAFSKHQIIYDLMANNIGILPEWLSNCGNSLLFMESLKTTHADTNWDRVIFDKLSKTIDQFFDDSPPYLTSSNLIDAYNKYYAIINRLLKHEAKDEICKLSYNL